MPLLIRGFLPLSCFLALASCGQIEGDAKVEVESWAIVNGSPMTAAQLDYSIKRFFGDQFVDARAELKIRESLIASRAISQKAESVLPAEDLADIELAVQAYREERLIAAYIQTESNPEPVSSQMVKDYYESNLEEFGASTIQRLQVLSASANYSELPIAQLTQQVYEFSKQDDWRSNARPSFIKEYQTNSNSQLSSKIRAAIEKIPVGETSGIIVDEDNVYLFKNLAEEKIPPKPLAEVSATIRKRLAATQLSKTVKVLTDEIVGASQVDRNY